MISLFNLLELIINLFLMVFLLRILLQLASANFFNPIAQFVHKMTIPVINPLRKVFPDQGKFSLASLVFVLMVIVLKFIIIGLVTGQMLPPAITAYSTLVGLFFPNGITVAGLFMLVYNLLLVLFISLMIMGFLSHNKHHPLLEFLHQVTRPILSPIQKIIPPIGGVIDLSPMVVLVLLYFAQYGLRVVGYHLFN